MGCHFLLQGIFPTQGSNPHLLCLLHCRQILYHLRLLHCRRILYHWATQEAPVMCISSQLLWKYLHLGHWQMLFFYSPRTQLLPIYQYTTDFTESCFQYWTLNLGKIISVDTNSLRYIRFLNGVYWIHVLNRYKRTIWCRGEGKCK